MLGTLDFKGLESLGAQLLFSEPCSLAFFSWTLDFVKNTTTLNSASMSVEKE